jgi:predicted MFS family arabinose efflux permease
MAASEETSAPQTYQRMQLFILSCVALTTAAMVFSLRANVMQDLGEAFGLTAEAVGAAVGVSFLGFTASVVIGGPLCDTVGMRGLLGIAAVLHILGLLIVVFAGGVAAGAAVLSIGMLAVGLAHGLVEAVINPLCATLFPDDKTHKMNVLHAWWPGGMIIGGLLGYLMANVNASMPWDPVGWRVQLGVILIPAVIYGALVAVTKFPPTERVEHGVATVDMWKEALRPLFIVWFVCMFFTAAMELGPMAWIEATLSKTVGFSGILILVYVSGLMFVLRHFAGPLAHKLSPIGLMWISALLAGIGLLALAGANNKITALIAATIWGCGVCYMWPTMLGVTSERFPRGGALLLGLMGGAGNLSVFTTVWGIGRVYDVFTQKFLPAGERLTGDLVASAATDPAVAQMLDTARAGAVPSTFRFVAALGIILVVVFGIIWFRDKAAGGYKAVDLAAEMGAEDAGDVSADDSSEE